MRDQCMQLYFALPPPNCNPGYAAFCKPRLLQLNFTVNRLSIDREGGNFPSRGYAVEDARSEVGRRILSVPRNEDEDNKS